MTFSFSTTIPAANNDPSDDQPIMLTNNGSIAGLIAVNHIGFNTTGGGQHKFVEFNGNNAPSPPAGNASVLFTAAGTAKPASPQPFWQNADATFHLPIKAWALVTEAGGIDNNQSSNVASINRPSTGRYDITLTTGATNSASFGVNITTSPNSGGFVTLGSYTLTGTNTFSVFISQPENTSNNRNAPFTFIVYQI